MHDLQASLRSIVLGTGSPFASAGFSDISGMLAPRKPVPTPSPSYPKASARPGVGLTTVSDADMSLVDVTSWVNDPADDSEKAIDDSCKQVSLGDWIC
jgi:hypothetical protein